MFRNFLKRRRVRKVFGEIVEPATIDALLSGKQLPLKRGPIEFVLALVRGETAEIVSERVAHMADIACRHSALIQSINGPLVIMVFGTHKLSSALPASRMALVEDLHTQLAGDIKIVHGGAEGCFGLFGNEKTIANFGFWMPQFDQVLGTLARLEYGRVEQFTS